MHPEKTIFAKNRHGNRLAIIVDHPETATGLAFIAHGLGSTKEQARLVIFAEEFVAHGYITVRFDARDTFGESEGDYTKASVTGYKEDLEDVIIWASKQPWYQEPFALAGSSLGGMTTILFAEDHPEKVSALLEFAPVISGNLFYQLKLQANPEKLRAWQETGWEEEASVSTPGRIKRLPWSHMEDRMRYDAIPKASLLAMPLLILVGTDDTSCPEEHQRLLFQALPEGSKKLEVIDGMPHTPREERHLKALRTIVNKWLSWPALP